MCLVGITHLSGDVFYHKKPLTRADFVAQFHLFSLFPTITVR